MQAPFDDLSTLVYILFPRYIHHKAKAVDELRTQVTLLRVHGADQHKARRVRIGDSLSLDGVDAHRSRIQQHVHNVVIQQVDLIHIQDISVCRRQDSGLKFLFAVLERVLHVQRSNHSILGGADRQVDNSHPPDGYFLLRLLTARLTPEGRVIRVTAKAAACDFPSFSQHLCQSADCGGFCRSLLSANQHAAQGRIDDIQYQCPLHLLLSHDSAEGVEHPFHVLHIVSSKLFSSSR